MCFDWTTHVFSWHLCYLPFTVGLELLCFNWFFPFCITTLRGLLVKRGEVSVWIALLSPATNLSSSFYAQSSWKSHLHYPTSHSFLHRLPPGFGPPYCQGCAGRSHQCPSVCVCPTPTVWIDVSAHLTHRNSLTSFPDSKMYPFSIHFCIETEVIFKDYKLDCEPVWFETLQCSLSPIGLPSLTTASWASASRASTLCCEVARTQLSSLTHYFYVSTPSFCSLSPPSPL